MESCKSASKKSIALALLGFIFYTTGLWGQVKQFQYDRIELNTSSQDIKFQAPMLSKTMDSIFGICAKNIQSFEVLLGYKLTGNIRLDLYTDLHQYQKNLQRHTVWVERLATQYTAESVNHYPIYIQSNFEDVTSQIKYAVSHFTLNEFLNGSSVRQKMSQSGAHQLPSWFIQGLCAYWSNGWNIEAKDEFDFFQRKGSFNNFNLIEPLGAQVYGRKVWKTLIDHHGNGAVSSLWFVLKYAGNTEAAIFYLTGLSFVDWCSEANLLPDLEDKLAENELQISETTQHSPIIEAWPMGQGNRFLFRRFSPDLEILETYPPHKSQFHYQQLHARLMAELSFYCTEIFVDVNNPAVLGIGFIVENKKLQIALDSFGVAIDTHTTKAGSLLKTNTSPNYNEKNIGKVYAFQKKDLGNDRVTYTLVCTENTVKTTLHIDTLAASDKIRCLIAESKNRLSYLQSQDGVWYVYFLQFQDSLSFRWRQEVLGGFAHQFKAITSMGFEQIIELSFVNDKSIFRRLEVAAINNNDLKELLKTHSVISPAVNSTTADSGSLRTKIEPPSQEWTFVADFAYRDMASRTKGQSLEDYAKGAFKQVSPTTHYGLDHGGIFLSNEEDTRFLNLAMIAPKSIYNSPFTPELRFYISNPKIKHRIKFGLLSNLPLNRKSIRLQQQMDLKKWNLNQGFMYRNRDYSKSESSLFKNVATQFTLGLSKQQYKGIRMGVEIGIQQDEVLRRVNRPFSVISKVQKHLNQSVKLYTSTLTTGKNHRQLYRYELRSSWDLSYARYRTLDIKWRSGFEMGCNIEFSKQLSPWARIESHGQLMHSGGAVKTQYWVGGSAGWISEGQWDGKHQKRIEALGDYPYRRFSGYVRGFRVGERMGSSSASVNTELIFNPYAFITKHLTKSAFYRSLRFYGLLDIGTAFIGGNPAEMNNPFNIETINTSSYTIEISAKRNPWIAGSGFGISSQILRMPIRYEMAWGLKEGRLLTPIQHVCMTWNF